MPSEAVVPSLPPWWLDEAGADDAVPVLDGETAADLCIVGGGFSGLWTALALKEREPSAGVVVVEADRCGPGPSGRDGGFLHGYWASLALARSLVGDQGALELARAGEIAIPAVRALGSDVWLREAGMLMVSASPTQDAAIDDAVRAAADLGAPRQPGPLGEPVRACLLPPPIFL